MVNMDLRTFLFLNKIQLKEFAKQIDYTSNQISEVMHGRRPAGKRLARAIEKATNGQVKAEDLIRKRGTTLSHTPEKSVETDEHDNQYHDPESN